MKKSLTILSLLSGVVTAFGQHEGRVGINTDTPQATFQVVGNPSNTNALDGLIAPKIEGSQLSNKTYTADQTGALVYVTSATSTTVPQTAEVTTPGYYYFDGSVWKPLKATTTVTNTPSTRNEYQAGQGMILTGNTFSRTGLERVGEDRENDHYGGYRFIFDNDTHKTQPIGNGAIDLNTTNADTHPDLQNLGIIEGTALGQFSIVTGSSNHTTETAGGAVVIGGASNYAAGGSSIVIGGYRGAAKGSGSIVIGGNTATANGELSLAMGKSTTTGTNAKSALAGGEYAKADGQYSFSYGNGTETYNRSEVALGQNNFSTDGASTSPTSFSSSTMTKQLFSIGNGTGTSYRSNAIVVLRDAKTGIGLSKEKPTEMLDVNGNIRVRGGRATEEGGDCTNNGTITYYDGNFFGCGNNVWKKLNL